MASLVEVRWFAAMWIAATALVFFMSPSDLLRHPRRLLRLPVPMLCWAAPT